METKPNSYEHATFAGGCFWCMVSPFTNQAGVIKVTSGYTGGNKDKPSYEEVCTGNTGHYEAIDVVYDPNQIRYDKLLEIFWQQINPTDSDGQFADRGSQYQTAIFYHTPDQKKLAEESKEKLAASGIFNQPVATKILAAKEFYPAEEFHQDYHQKNPNHYQAYRKGSGHQDFLDQTWGHCNISRLIQPKSSSEKADLEQILSPIQYRVTQENATEPPFQNEFWDHHRAGIYVDIASGEPLFSSLDKFDSGCGWPSFDKPINQSKIIEKEDQSHGMIRTEVRSKDGDSHLGHVFEDGPTKTGLRYCINSAALKFIPKEDLEKEGYEEYLGLFKK